MTKAAHQAQMNAALMRERSRNLNATTTLPIGEVSNHGSHRRLTPLSRPQAVARTVAASHAVHGFMEIHYWVLNNGHERPKRIKELLLNSREDAHCSPLLRLTDAEQTRLKRLDMVYTGTERVGDETCPQAWWVKVDIRPKGNGFIPRD